MEQPVELIKEQVPDFESASELMGRMFTITRPDAVFAEPVTQGDYTAITANEVSVGLGFGYGGGGGHSEGQQERTMAETTTGPSTGFGSGGGGGGGAMARPVAVIEIGPQGVRVEPIVDPTKIALAFFTAFGSMFLMLSRMRRQAGG